MTKMNKPLSIKIGNTTKYLYEDDYSSVRELSDLTALAITTIRKRMNKVVGEIDMSTLLYSARWDTNSIVYYVDGVGKTMNKWVASEGILYETLYSRVVKRGMSMKEAINIVISPRTKRKRRTKVRPFTMPEKKDSNEHLLETITKSLRALGYTGDSLFHEAKKRMASYER